VQKQEEKFEEEEEQNLLLHHFVNSVGYKAIIEIENTNK
jgi:hypothetical protein